MHKPRYTIAVTGLNAIDSPGPGLAVIRALRAATSFQVRIIGLSYEALEPVIYLHDQVDKTYQIPYPSAGQDVLFERIAYIRSREGAIDFLFPNFDAELYNFIKLEQRLASALGIRMFLPTAEQFDARHKVQLYEFGSKHGLDVPFANAVFSVSEVEAAARGIGFPLAVKGKYYDASIAYNADQAKQYFNKINAKWGLPVLLQQFVTGTEVNVCGVGDGKGNVIGAVPMRKLYITDKGKAWAGITLDDEELVRITGKMVQETNWRGPFEMEFVKSADKYYLLEINPRFPAWCYLTVGAGQNQIEAVVNLAMGVEVEPFDDYKKGTMFIRYANDLIVDIKEFEKISTEGEL